MMNRMALILIVSSIFTFINISLPANASDITTISIVTPEWDGTTNSDGSGLYFDIIRSVFEPSGIQLKYEIVPWKRAVHLVKSYKADAFPGAYYISSRKDFNDIFPLYPIDTETTSVVYKKGKIKKWKGQESIAGKDILWLRGYNYHKHLDVKVTFYEIDKPEQAFYLIDLGRYNFYMDALSDIQIYIRKKMFDSEKYAVSPVIHKNLYLRFANTKKSKKLIEIYDKMIPKLIASGEIKRIFEKWNREIVPLASR